MQDKPLDNSNKKAFRERQKKQIRRVFCKEIFRSLWRISANAVLFILAFGCGFFEVVWFYIKQKLFGNRIPNYHAVDDLLYRGGQPSNAGIKDLARQGVKTIINLRVGDFNKKVIEEYYSDQIRTIHLPFYPYEPQDTLMIEFLKIMVSLKGAPAYVHCFHGADRTGTVCAIYRIILQDWDKERAIKEMKLKGLHWWHTNLIDYILNLDTEAIKRQIGLVH